MRELPDHVHSLVFPLYAQTPPYIGLIGSTCNVDENGCLGDPCNTSADCQDLTPSVQKAEGLTYQCSACPQGYTLSSSLKCIGKLIVNQFLISLVINFL